MPLMSTPPPSQLETPQPLNNPNISPLQIYLNEFDLLWDLEAELKTSECKTYFD